MADSGVPEPKPGLVTDAHGGILFIDEIGEMDAMLQNKLPAGEHRTVFRDERCQRVRADAVAQLQHLHPKLTRSEEVV